MAVVDERMSPHRYLDLSVGVERRVVGRLLVVPQAEPGRFRRGRLAGPHHFEQHFGQFVGTAVAQRDARPHRRALGQFGECRVVEAGLQRQQCQHRRLLRIPADLHRTHRRAAGCRRQQAPAAVGEEYGVDQLRLAARELGHKGDHQPVVGQPLPERGDRFGDGRVGQFVVGEKAAQFAEPPADRSAPVAQGVDAAGEKGRHAGTRARTQTGTGHPSAACCRKAPSVGTVAAFRRRPRIPSR